MRRSLSKITTRNTVEWAKLEPYMFWALAVVNLVPVFGVPYFLTGDGPAHLYNAHIINSLLFDDHSVYHNFFTLRHELIPNVGGHALLALLSAVFNPFLAEKILYGIILVSFPLAFRYAARSFATRSTPAVLVVFLLAHNFILQIGFQSFYLGLVLTLLVIGYFNTLLNNGMLKHHFFWSILLFITALFHLFAAAFGLIVCFFVLVDRVLKTRFRNLSTYLPLGLATLPTLIFGLSYIAGRDGGEWSSVFTGKWDSFLSLLRISAFKQGETPAIVLFFTLMIGGSVYAFFQDKLKRQRPLLVVFLVMIALYFLLPNNMASGGYISIRLLYCALLLWALWLAVRLASNKIALALGALFALTTVLRIPFLVNYASALSDDVAEMISAQPYIQNGHTLVPLNYSNHWLHYNLGLYLGAEKDIVVLDNYEAVTDHFPVQWRKDVYIAGWLGDAFMSSRPKLEIRYFEWRTNIHVDHVLQWRHNSSMQDTATLFTDSALVHDFDRSFVSPGGQVKLFSKEATH